MRAVILDADTLGLDIDWSPVKNTVSEIAIFGSTRPEQLAARLVDCEIILTNKVVIPSELLAHCKAVMVMATGTNVVDHEAAKALGIPIYNVENYGTNYVAQHTLMLLLALAARLPNYQRDLRNGAWAASESFCLLNHQTTELAGKHCVIVGSGSIGQRVGQLAEAFGMRVSFCARPGAADDPRPSFESLLPEADVLTFHCPLNVHTQGLLGAVQLPLLKPECLVINCARGGVIDEIACLKALQAKQLGGLAVDVLPEEPPKTGHPLLDALAGSENLIVTPHNAWISPGARQNIVNLTAKNIRDFLALSSQ